MAIKKSGPPPVLTETAETDLEAWVIGMQYQGYPVSREKIITKGNKINQEMNGSTRSTGFLGRGWIEKFMKRHPRLFSEDLMYCKEIPRGGNRRGTPYISVGSNKKLHQKKHDTGPCVQYGRDRICTEVQIEGDSCSWISERLVKDGGRFLPSHAGRGI